MTTQIPLTHGLMALVDDDDAELVSAIKWHARRQQKKEIGWYAVNGRGGSKPTLNGIRYMHRVILAPPPELFVDHINGNGLDNRRSNLRIVDRRGNNLNRPHPGGASKYRGVFPTPYGRWRARVSYFGKGHCLGNFLTEEEAARAYDAGATELHGRFAILNFPIEAR